MPEPARAVRILLVADSHLGFDHPVRPRVKRRRRGHDFLANYQRACRTAIEERVDLLVHGGDVFHQPTAVQSLVYQAFDPLKEVADAGIPVFLVPGNHERSRIPFDWLARHPDVHVFADPGTVCTSIGGCRVAVTGLPCIRRDARTRFVAELERAAWEGAAADVRLLVTHQAFEGAVVGPSDFTFRRNHDVVRMADVPAPFAAVLSGHIHRSQVLETDLGGSPSPAPVFYPGSVERTAFAERHEPKGFLILEIDPSAAGGAVRSWEFRDLSARPMEVRPLPVAGLSAARLERALREAIGSVPADAVLRLEADGAPEPEAAGVFGAERLRALAPDTMNVDVVIPGQRRWSGRRQEGTRSARSPEGAGSPDVGTAAPGSAVQGDLF